MKRLSSWALPIILGVAGVALIIVGSLDLDAEPTTSLPPIARPSATATVAPTGTAPPSQTDASSPSVEPSTAPTQSPLPASVVAVQLEVPSVGVNVLVKQSLDAATDAFPPTDASYILRASSQPGRNTNSYIFAHALNTLFKPLWNVQIGAELSIRMSDESVLSYVITEVRPNVPCPTDPNPELDPPDPPLALQIHDDCTEGAFWTAPTGYERVTLQTSQGFNRNWGELIIVAEPVS